MNKLINLVRNVDRSSILSKVTLGIGIPILAVLIFLALFLYK